jgi:hypothetical protein
VLTRDAEADCRLAVEGETMFSHGGTSAVIFFHAGELAVAGKMVPIEDVPGEKTTHGEEIFVLYDGGILRGNEGLRPAGRKAVRT